MLSVALKHCATYDEPALEMAVGEVLDKASLPVSAGQRILVKPNLLMTRPLACTSPQVVAAVCRWLMDRGAHVAVGDSPGFGSAKGIARSIGLEEALAPLGLKVGSFSPARRHVLNVDGRKIRVALCGQATESDMIVSVARVKAHAQLRMTMCVKNCFGCVPGVRKAFAHTLHGASRDFFCDFLVQIWRSLPPVAAVADGICAMHVTGPSRGQPYPLHFLGASVSAPALDLAVLEAIGIAADSVPLAMALKRAGFTGSEAPLYPLETPADFVAPGFVVPGALASASFNPLRLARSCLRRWWAAWKPSWM